MRFALSVPNVGDPAELVRFGVEAERVGFDAFFLWDHIHLRRELHLEVHDPWVVLGAVAHATSTIRLGALVTPLARRRPWKLAKEITTLDHLSGGRVIVGVGLGAPDHDDFGAFGDPERPRDRAERLDEGLTVLDALLRGGEVRHQGRHYRVDADLRPAALQRPRPPIWVAAVKPHRRPLERALRWDGVAPIALDGNPLSPDGLRDYLAGVSRPDGWDVVSPRREGEQAASYAAAGATWLVESIWPDPGWQDELRARALSGRPA
jgi:alkanesulfonate monooxygenase SsuD/methylene tetrahydromethanopterin reductase-like flavin-dependent oxidoreductase (luciferase family)